MHIKLQYKTTARQITKITRSELQIKILTFMGSVSHAINDILV